MCHICHNCSSAHLTYGHMTLLTGPDANNWISFFVNIQSMFAQKIQCCILLLMGETLTSYIIDKLSFIQTLIFQNISILTTKAECKLPESLINYFIMADTHEKHVVERK